MSFALFSLEMTNQNDANDILTETSHETILIKLQSDADGRYGFNVKVIDQNFHFLTRLKMSTNR